MKAFVETLKGSSRRTRYDEETLAFKDSLEIGLEYPHAYGFIPNSNGTQNDCVDCYIISDIALNEGSLVDCDVLGMIEMYENGEIDHKVLLAHNLQKDIDIAAEAERIRQFIRMVFARFKDADVAFGDVLSRDDATEFVRANMR